MRGWDTQRPWGPPVTCRRTPAAAAAAARDAADADPTRPPRAGRYVPPAPASGGGLAAALELRLRGVQGLGRRQGGRRVNPGVHLGFQSRESFVSSWKLEIVVRRQRPGTLKSREAAAGGRACLVAGGATLPRSRRLRFAGLIPGLSRLLTGKRRPEAPVPIPLGSKGQEDPLRDPPWRTRLPGGPEGCWTQTSNCSLILTNR